MKRPVFHAVVTREQLLESFRKDDEDRAAVLFFLVQAERENLMLNGRTAREAVEAVGRLLRLSQEDLSKIRGIGL